MSRLVLVLLMCAVSIIAKSQGTNFSHKYDPNTPFQLLSKVIYNKNSTDVLLKIHSTDSLLSYEGMLDFRASYSSSKSDSLANLYLENAIYDQHDKSWLLDISFPKIERKRLLLLQFVHKQTGMSYYFDLPLYWNSNINISSTILYDSLFKEAIMDRYLNTNMFYQTDQTEFVHNYRTNYQAASPPMSSAKKPTEEIAIDTTFFIASNQRFQFEEEGMYFIENDSSDLNGTAYCVFDKPFPKYTSIDKLVPPMRYLATNSEYETLLASPDKATFEKTWLSITNDVERAKQIIKSYYKQVEIANVLFTSFKAGWKTDMGMIYIIFGVPNEVLKTNSKEEWIYNGTSQQSKLTFTFAKVDNAFSPNYYMLVRKKEYRTAWMNRVDLWRKGRIK